MSDDLPFIQLLEAGASRGGLQTEDVLALVLPLFREVAGLHADEKIADLGDPRSVAVSEVGTLGLRDPQGHAAREHRDAVEKLQAPVSSVLQVVGESRVTQDPVDYTSEDLLVANAPTAEALTRPVYLPGYRCWEQVVGHHDAVTDIFCLGQVLASLSCDLDFTDEDDVRSFARHRNNLFELQPRLHPVVASIIVEMTELDRRRRAKDLASLITRLETYREQPQDLAIERVLAGQTGEARQQRAVQAHLRDRLFDLSRRNRLLHFRPTQSSVNLTVASVPLVVDMKNIRLDQLCVWGGKFAAAVGGGDKVLLANWLRFEDQPYLPSALDRIMQEDRRDRTEYGLSQLSLVLAFFRWHNLKEAKDERIVSPLLLLPVELTRKKGVRDQYVLQAQAPDAEVNPVLRHQLRLVYGIELPETVDLTDEALAVFHRSLQASIAASEPGVRLNLVDKPEIELIHQRARQRLEQFRRRRRNVPARAAAPSALDTDYSYAEDDFRPLGLKLFHERVRPAALPLRDALGAAPVPRHPNVAPAAAGEDERTTFALRERTGNPYEWDLDLTSVTLGNFNYRKMSLVRDYNALVEGDIANEAFKRVFSLKPRALEDRPVEPIPLPDRWTVVPADATQMAAVALARSGESYIIQGPPGTGKSQTITNLIADQVGRGKRVLFVCEKRAAIDVVFHRLRQQRLDELCCMIHDSQTDKKGFVLDLKQTYEQWLANADVSEELMRQRARVAELVQEDLSALERFDAAMRSGGDPASLSAHALLRRLVALAPYAAELPAAAAEALPDYAAWQAHAGLALRIGQVLQEVFGVSALADHVFARLSDGLVRAEQPLGTVLRFVDTAEPMIDAIADALAPLWPEAESLEWAALKRLADFSRRLTALGDSAFHGLLDAQSDAAKAFESERAGINGHARKLAQAQALTVNWRRKLTSADTAQALAQASAQEASALRWLSPSWWRLRGVLNAHYDFSAHAVKPKFARLLTELSQEHEAAEQLDAARARFAGHYGTPEADSYADELQALRTDMQAHASLRGFSQALAATGSRISPEGLTDLVTKIDGLGSVLASSLRDIDALPLDGLGELVRDLRECADSLPEVLPLLRELTDANPAFAAALHLVALPPAGIEYVIARESLERIYRKERWLPRFDAAALARHAERIGLGEKQLLELNADVARALVRQRFRENVRRSMLAASQLDEGGKQFKKSYSAGRRELEHEFGKTMRYKSIRELASGDTGRVVRDMKPIWLMSPLSVSDTLPMSGKDFDVVIFDEASQIPVEEAVPALYRAPQVIIVGDEMQLPPTSFFSSNRDEQDESVSVDGDEGERLSVVLDADSLLNQGARNLPATLLAWHYRSRSESLIGFSNAAFYGGNLYTIPDRAYTAAGQSDVVVRDTSSADAAQAGAAALLSRPVSFHHLPDAVYAERSNLDEAGYIARMTRDLLAREGHPSIGIVAFSEAQQSEIESALEALSADDAEFAARLEAEYVREEDDQFCGLFVKNLENVQGDERDIIILSICYGPGPAPARKMVMNFGPINQRGGEKRLNVIFSRARHHMAVVTSIRHESITNDYNDGAAALKQFLRYAEHLSHGQAQLAQSVLEAMNPATRSALGGRRQPEDVIEQLAQALRERGHVVDTHVGQSRFRCELALRDGESGLYRLGVLVDTEAQYGSGDVHERYVSRPRILGSFDWHTVQVLSKDWFHQPEAVIEQIQRALRDGPSSAHSEADLQPLTAALADAAEGQALPAVALALAGEPAPAASPLPSVPSGGPVMRRFEHTEGGSRKFWSIGRKEMDVVVCYGRIDTRGQTQIKCFDSESRAEREVQKLVAEKLRKGYAEVAGSA